MDIEFDKLRKVFDRQAFCDVYVKRCGLRKQQADQFLNEAFQIQQMRIPGLTWLPTSHLISVYPNIPLLIHFEALDAAVHQPFDSIENFFRRSIEKGLLPPWTLNQTRFYKIPDAKLYIGRLMYELGLISENALQRCLGIQMIIQNKGLKPALATIISSVERISIPDIFQALGIQCGMPFESLDASAPAIFAATGKRISQGDKL